MKFFVRSSVCLIAVSAVVGALFPMFAQSKHSGPIPGLSRIKQFGLGIAVYEIDYDESFPPDMSCGHGIWNYVEPYIKNPAVLDSLNPESPEWLGNGTLSGSKSILVANPEETLCLFDSASRQPKGTSPFRFVCFVDNHARSAKESEFQDSVRAGFEMSPSSGSRP